jgi:hypothetical protein
MIHNWLQHLDRESRMTDVREEEGRPAPLPWRRLGLQSVRGAVARCFELINAPSPTTET